MGVSKNSERIILVTGATGRQGGAVYQHLQNKGFKLRALVRDPQILLLDEPFEGLAPIIVRDLVSACRDLAAAGQTIVLVEQNIAATLTLAHRVYIINNGHVVHERPARELKENPQVLHRYLGV